MFILSDEHKELQEDARSAAERIFGPTAAEDDEARAATKIQAGFRGSQVRKEIERCGASSGYRGWKTAINEGWCHLLWIFSELTLNPKGQTQYYSR